MLLTRGPSSVPVWVMWVSIIGLLLIGLLITSCGIDDASDAQTDGAGGTTYVEWVNLHDGTEVRCLIWEGYKSGGPSCDWANVRPIGSR